MISVTFIKTLIKGSHIKKFHTKCELTVWEKLLNATFNMIEILKHFDNWNVSLEYLANLHRAELKVFSIWLFQILAGNVSNDLIVSSFTWNKMSFLLFLYIYCKFFKLIPM